MSESSDLAERIFELIGHRSRESVKIITDTTEWMDICRGQVFRLDGRDFLVKGNARETRFGIEGQPKPWVFNVVEMATGESKIIKTVFHEEFHVRIGLFKMRCYRSSRKEARVLDLVKGDRRFMQGHTLLDEKGNHVRIIDFIRGQTFFNYIALLNKSHDQYYHEDLPGLLWKLRESIEAIQFLHGEKTCHGDIRNDHIIIETGTGLFRWIDFDLTQDVSDFDVWSIGNILSYAVAKGIRSFHQVLKDKSFPAEVRDSIRPEDASAFYEYRIMNLKKLYPYIPPKLNELLLHFTIRPKAYYSRFSHFMNEYNEMLDTEFPQR